MELGARVRRRHRRRVVTVIVAIVTIVVVAGVASGLGWWFTRSHDTARHLHADSASVSRDPSRFQIRPVVAIAVAPCAAGQLPSRATPGAAPSCYAVGPVAVDGRDAASASVSTTSQDGVGIDLQLTSTGMDKFNALAASSYARPSPQNQAAIVVDGTVVSAPPFNSSYFANDSIRISGNLTDAEARRIADVITPPTPATATSKLRLTPETITQPCRFLTLADARKLVGPTAVSGGDQSPGECTYTTAPTTSVSGITTDVGPHPSLSVQLWQGQIPLSSAAGAGCVDCIPGTVNAIAGIGDRAAWYELAPEYQTGPFPGGNLDVQVGTTAVRITVASIADAESVALATARVLVPRLAS